MRIVSSVLHVGIFPYTKVEYKVSTPNDLSDFSYSYLKLPECLYTTSRIGKNEWALVYKTVGLSLLVKSELSIF